MLSMFFKILYKRGPSVESHTQMILYKISFEIIRLEPDKFQARAFAKFGRVQSGAERI